MAFKYFNKQCPNYLNEVFHVATESNFQLRSSFQKLKCLFRKTNSGQNALSYIGPTFWNQSPHTRKRSNNLNTFKHSFKKYDLKVLKILITLFKLVFIFNCKHPNFSAHILIFEPHDSLLLRDHNVNTSFYKHVLCHPANSESVFFNSVNID